ncbi:MAG TPA: hypothetical protein VNI20_07330 [Fimbriimonadaceae bacterium]|nr:hypothetical protein [Fimbriimonadaceae bacterium]
MQITDFESGKQLRDVDIVLSREEAEDLLAYIAHLLSRPGVPCAHLSEIDKWTLKREITVSVKRRKIN